MDTQQKVISANIHTGIEATSLAETLNAHAGDGWRLEQASTLIVRRRGAIAGLRLAYYFDTYHLVLAKSETRHEYRCHVHARMQDVPKDLDAINATIDGQAQEGFRLAMMLQMESISPDVERPTPGNVGCVMIFERSE